jgi:processive 1,2-diacylglycerol beta-glucosyltransferase
MNDRIVILTGNYGDGHRQAAHAVRKYLEDRKPNAEVMVVDFMELAHPLTHHVSRYVFIEGLKRFPSVYGYIFNKTREANSWSSLLKKTNRLGAARLLKFLEEVRPTLVVSTFPNAAGAVESLKAYGLTRVPTMTVITDLTVHSLWVYPDTDKYIVGSEDVRDRLIARGVPRYRIDVTGIPVRQEFLKQYDREALSRKHGLSSKLATALIMGGGCGLFGGDLVKQMQLLESLEQEMQFIVVCGSNERLRQQLLDYSQKSKHRFIVTGYIDYVHEMMAVADLIVTKPGGLTISEAMAMKLPMLLCKPLPGQEEDNARFLMQAGVGMRVEAINELPIALGLILSDKALLQTMRERMAELHIRSTSIDVADAVLGVGAPIPDELYAETVKYVI